LDFLWWWFCLLMDFLWRVVLSFCWWFFRQTREPPPQPSPAFDNCRTVHSWSTSPPETIEGITAKDLPKPSRAKPPHHGLTVQSSCPDHSSDRTTAARFTAGESTPKREQSPRPESSRERPQRFPNP
jgi:hypothetical protein